MYRINRLTVQMFGCQACLCSHENEGNEIKKFNFYANAFNFFLCSVTLVLVIFLLFKLLTLGYIHYEQKL